MATHTAASAGSSTAADGTAAPDYPASALTFKQRGTEAYKQGNFDQAIALYKKARDLAPGAPVHYANLAAAFLQVRAFHAAAATAAGGLIFQGIDAQIRLKLERRLEAAKAAMVPPTPDVQVPVPARQGAGASADGEHAPVAPTPQPSSGTEAVAPRSSPPQAKRTKQLPPFPTTHLGTGTHMGTDAGTAEKRAQKPAAVHVSPPAAGTGKTGTGRTGTGTGTGTGKTLPLPKHGDGVAKLLQNGSFGSFESFDSTHGAGGRAAHANTYTHNAGVRTPLDTAGAQVQARETSEGDDLVGVKDFLGRMKGKNFGPRFSPQPSPDPKKETLPAERSCETADDAAPLVLNSQGSFDDAAWEQHCLKNGLSPDFQIEARIFPDGTIETPGLQQLMQTLGPIVTDVVAAKAKSAANVKLQGATGTQASNKVSTARVSKKGSDVGSPSVAGVAFGRDDDISNTLQALYCGAGGASKAKGDTPVEDAVADALATPHTEGGETDVPGWATNMAHVRGFRCMLDGLATADFNGHMGTVKTFHGTGKGARGKRVGVVLDGEKKPRSIRLSNLRFRPAQLKERCDCADCRAKPVDSQEFNTIINVEHVDPSFRDSDSEDSNDGSDGSTDHAATVEVCAEGGTKGGTSTATVDMLLTGAPPADGDSVPCELAQTSPTVPVNLKGLVGLRCGLQGLSNASFNGMQGEVLGDACERTGKGEPGKRMAVLIDGETKPRSIRITNLSFKPWHLGMSCPDPNCAECVARREDLGDDRADAEVNLARAMLQPGPLQSGHCRTQHEDNFDLDPDGEGAEVDDVIPAALPINVIYDHSVPSSGEESYQGREPPNPPCESAHAKHADVCKRMFKNPNPALHVLSTGVPFELDPPWEDDAGLYLCNPATLTEEDAARRITVSTRDADWFRDECRRAPYLGLPLGEFLYMARLVNHK